MASIFQIFKPIDRVNCKKELDLFDILLKCKSEKRILAIKSKSGSGKTTLLDKLEHLCQSSKIPVARIDLNEANVQVPLDVVQKISQELKISNVQLPTFEDALDCYVDKDLKGILDVRKKMSSGSIVQLANSSERASNNDYVSMNFQDTSFDNSSGLGIIGQQININGIEVEQIRNLMVSLSQNRELTDEQVERSRLICIQAFFHDIYIHRWKKRNARFKNKKPLVLIFDTYEKTGDSVKEWFDKALQKHFFDIEHRPRNLLAVIGGQYIPDFDKITNSDLQNRVIMSVDKLSQWSEEDVEMAANLKNVPEAENAFKTMYKLKPNMTPLELLQMMDSFAKAGTGAKAR